MAFWVLNVRHFGFKKVFLGSRLLEHQHQRILSYFILPSQKATLLLLPYHFTIPSASQNSIHIKILFFNLSLLFLSNRHFFSDFGKNQFSWAFQQYFFSSVSLNLQHWFNTQSHTHRPMIHRSTYPYPSPHTHSHTYTHTNTNHQQSHIHTNHQTNWSQQRPPHPPPKPSVSKPKPSIRNPRCRFETQLI